MSEAMRQVRDTLGDDAIIVNTREEAGGWVKITAAAEQESRSPAEAPITPAARKEAESAEEALDAVTEAMLRHRVPAATGEKIISAAASQPGRDARKMLAAALKKVFPFDAEPTPVKKHRPIVLVGPPGAGKTLMTAKLAARAVLGGHKPAVITTDIARAGGIEQLSAFLNILSLPLHCAEDAKSLKTALGKIKGATQTIIDTGGLNPFDPHEMKTLARLLNTEEMDAALVLPAGTDAEESAEIAMTFAVLGVRRLIPTRLDFSRHIGGILSAADRARMSFGEGSHTPQVADGILHLTPETMAALLLPAASPKKKK